MAAIGSLHAQTKPGTTDYPEMVPVAGGSFKMGSTSAMGDEAPIHEVTVSSFEIGKYEVTVGQFRKFVNASGYKTSAEKAGGANVYGGHSAVYKEGVNWQYDPLGNKIPKEHEDHAVSYISWEDATAYCKWLSKETGKNFRLPTEAEWEFAASGGNKSKGMVYAGARQPDAIAWYKGNSLGQDVHGVGKKKPNELGIYDMTGNVSEWCSDFYSRDYFAESPANDPQGPSAGEYHVIHGGGSWSDEDVCRISHRFSYYDSNVGYPTNGFRVACSAK